jgi:hypothetical protein
MEIISDTQKTEKNKLTLPKSKMLKKQRQKVKKVISYL